MEASSPSSKEAAASSDHADAIKRSCERLPVRDEFCKSETISEADLSPAQRLAKRLRLKACTRVKHFRASDDDINRLEDRLRLGGSITAPCAETVWGMFKRVERSGRAIRALSYGSGAQSAFARQKLVEQTIENIRCLEKLPPRDLQRIAAGLPLFPFLVSIRKTAWRAVVARQKQIQLGSALAPGNHVNARWKKDVFAAIAEQLLVDYFRGEIPYVSAADWPKLREELKRELQPLLTDGSSMFADQASGLKQGKQKLTEGRRRARIVDVVLKRARALVGIRTDRARYPGSHV